MYAWQKLCPAILVAMTDGYWDARGAAEALRDESLWITYYERFQKVGAPESYLKADGMIATGSTSPVRSMERRLTHA